MPADVLAVEVIGRVLSPAQSELEVCVTPGRQLAGADLRGRFLGPRCRYASTVEVAYPLRPLARPADAGAVLRRRVVIPEPSFWDPQSPFLYRGKLELWHAGRCAARFEVSHGLRLVALRRAGLMVNGRPLVLRGRELAALSEEGAQHLRHAGGNLAVLPVEAGEDAWRVADEVGLFLLGKVTTRPAEGGPDLAGLARHPSCLGWVVAETLWREAPEVVAGLLALPGEARVGLEVGEPAADLPAGAHFLVGPAPAQTADLPVLLTGQGGPLPEGAMGGLSDQ